MLLPLFALWYMATDSTSPDSSTMWELESDCDCPGPPPEFLLPPPPRPPFLQTDVYCSEDPIPDIETCGAVPILDASYHSSPSFQTSAVIGICSALLAAVVLISVLLVLKHRRKVQNFIPCKSNNPGSGRCDSQGSSTPGAAVLYEDLPENPRPTPLPRHVTHAYGMRPPGGLVPANIEMLDVKNGIHYPSGYPMPRSPPVFVCSSPGPDPYTSQDLYHPVYEELSTGRDSDAESDLVAPHESEDDFAEDELSLTGDGELRLRAEMHPPPYVSTIHPRELIDERARILGNRNMSLPYRQQQPLPPIPSESSRRAPRSLDRRRGWKRGVLTPKEPSEFHEGMLLDALLQFQKNGNSNIRQPVPSVAHGLPYILPHSVNHHRPIQHDINPYETIPVLSHLHQASNHGYPRDFTTFRAPSKIYSQDSSFGSDSGYSNHTHTSGTRSSNRGRRDQHRLSANSSDLAIS